MDSSNDTSKSETSPADVAEEKRSPREIERASLKSLRDHVSKAVEEIVRLRAQNKSLARRLAEFEAADGNATLTFEDGADLEEIKTRIGRFVTAIDRYLVETDQN